MSDTTEVDAIDVKAPLAVGHHKVPLFLLREPIGSLYRLRRQQPKAVQTLAYDMDRNGLKTPISVRVVQGRQGGKPADVLEIVAGLHRVAAAKKLGWTEIDAVVVEMDDTAARQWRIAENFARADLSVKERAENFKEWKRLNQGKQSPAHLEPVKSRRADGRGGSVGSGINATARGLGIDRNEAQRLDKISNIPDDVMDAADTAGITTQKDLLAVANAVDQAEKVKELVAAKTAPPPVLTVVTDSDEDAYTYTPPSGLRDWCGKRDSEYQHYDDELFEKGRDESDPIRVKIRLHREAVRNRHDQGTAYRLPAIAHNWPMLELTAKHKADRAAVLTDDFWKFDTDEAERRGAENNKVMFEGRVESRHCLAKKQRMDATRSETPTYLGLHLGEWVMTAGDELLAFAGIIDEITELKRPIEIFTAICDIDDAQAYADVVAAAADLSEAA